MIYGLKSILYVFFLILIFSLLGCKIPSLDTFFNPAHGTNHSYKAIPLRSDSIHSAIYVSSLLSSGSNTPNDGIIALQPEIYRAHVFNHFQAYYGGTVGWGLYKIRRYKDPDYLLNSKQRFLNKNSGWKFFGTYGLDAGFNFVIGGKGLGEWRILGIEGSIQREYGQYYRLRQTFPDSIADLFTRKASYPFLAVTSEIVGKNRYGSSGYKIAYCSWLQNLNMLQGTVKNKNQYRFPKHYLANTLFTTRKRSTHYLQLNFGMSILILNYGFIYNLK